MAASGGYKMLQSVRNAYAMGKVRMVASEFETATRVVKNRGPSGRRATASRAGQLRAMDHGPWDVVRRARRRRQQSPRRLQRPPRLAPHPLARRPRR